MAYRTTALALAIISLGGCTSGEENAIKACEGFVQDNLRSPSTYVRIEAIAGPHEDTSRFRYTSITYDAANAYGTPIRGNMTCAFVVDPKSGDFPDADSMKFAASGARTDTVLRQVRGEESDPAGFDCCVAEKDREAARKAF